MKRYVIIIQTKCEYIDASLAEMIKIIEIIMFEEAPILYYFLTEFVYKLQITFDFCQLSKEIKQYESNVICFGQILKEFKACGTFCFPHSPW